MRLSIDHKIPVNDTNTKNPAEPGLACIPHSFLQLSIPGQLLDVIDEALLQLPSPFQSV